jgi:hypothetical protein
VVQVADTVSFTSAAYLTITPVVLQFTRTRPIQKSVVGVGVLHSDVQRVRAFVLTPLELTR